MCTLENSGWYCSSYFCIAVILQNDMQRWGDLLKVHVSIKGGGGGLYMDLGIRKGQESTTDTIFKMHLKSDLHPLAMPYLLTFTTPSRVIMRLFQGIKPLQGLDTYNLFVTRNVTPSTSRGVLHQCSRHLSIQSS